MIISIIMQHVEAVSKTTPMNVVLEKVLQSKILPVVDNNNYPIGIVDIHKLYSFDFKIDNLEAIILNCQVIQSHNELSEIKIDSNFTCALVIENGQYVGFVDATMVASIFEKKCKTQNDELMRILNKNKRAQKKELEYKNVKSLATLVAGVAHEINTPLGICITAMTLLEDKTKTILSRYENAKATKHDFEDYLSIAKESSELVLANLQTTIQLTKEFKNVSIEQTGDNEVHQFYILDFLRLICKKISPELTKKNVTIILSGDENIELKTNKYRFEQIITNLIMNSLIHGYKDAPDGGNIKIYVDADDKNFSLNYADDGKGIEPEVIMRIFDPFFTTAKGNGGSGLGMYVAYNIVTQSLGGSIRCYESLTKGARFSINAPLELKSR